VSPLSFLGLLESLSSSDPYLFLAVYFRIQSSVRMYIYEVNELGLLIPNFQMNSELRFILVDLIYLFLYTAYIFHPKKK